MVALEKDFDLPLQDAEALDQRRSYPNGDEYLEIANDSQRWLPNPNYEGRSLGDLIRAAGDARGDFNFLDNVQDQRALARTADQQLDNFARQQKLPALSSRDHHEGQVRLWPLREPFGYTPGVDVTGGLPDMKQDDASAAKFDALVAQLDDYSVAAQYERRRDLGLYLAAQNAGRNKTIAGRILDTVIEYSVVLALGLPLHANDENRRERPETQRDATGLGTFIRVGSLVCVAAVEGLLLRHSRISEPEYVEHWLVPSPSYGANTTDKDDRA